MNFYVSCDVYFVFNYEYYGNNSFEEIQKKSENTIVITLLQKI